MSYSHLYNFYTTACSFLWLLYLMSQAIYVITSLNDIVELTFLLFTGVAYSANFIKTIIMYSNSEVIESWIEKLNQPIFQPKCKEHYNMAQSSKKFYKKLFYTFLYFGVQSSVFFCILPFFRKEKSMVSVGWFPCDWKVSPNYEIIFAFQCSIIFWNTMTCLTLDLFSAGLLIQISLQCDYLIVTLNCLNTCFVENGVLRKRDESSGHLIQRDSKRFSDTITTNLIVCIEHYKEIKKLSKEIEKLHRTSIFFLFAGAEIFICSALFQITSVTTGTIEFFLVVFSLVTFLMEQFIYCWFGNDIIHKSEKIPDAIYNTPWLECDLQYKKILVNFMIQTKLPINIMVGKLFPMSIPVFKSIVQAAYSFFTVLKHMQDKRI
nr:odorant receptor 43a-like [Leptinotarsa decemlineata]